MTLTSKSARRGVAGEALDTLLDGRTAVLIAHRVATARRVDGIAVVHEPAPSPTSATPSSYSSAVAYAIPHTARSSADK